MTSNDHNKGSEPQREVIEPEVLEPDQRARRGGGQTYNGNDPRGASRGGRVTWVYGWPAASIDRNGCLAPGITMCIFVICWAQYGFLAALGFFFFHLVFGIIGSVQASRNLMAGRSFNMWLWRCWNWVFSFFITIWLAGGLQN